MKKLVCMLLCLIAVVALFAGCNNSATTDPGGNSSTTGTNGETGTGEKITITIGLPESPYVTDYEVNDFTLWLEETTGYNIDIKKYSTSDYATQFSTETGGGMKLPDIFYYFRLGDKLVDQYGEDGFFIDLSPYLNDKEKSKVFWEQMEALTEFEQNKLWMMMHSTRDYESSIDEAPIYAYPTMEIGEVDNMDFQIMINKEWLKNLNLQAPKSLDELVTVLRAFRDQDANGNGDPSDEVPMLGATKSSTLGHNLIDWLINFYIYYDDSVTFNVGKDGKLYIPVTTDKYKEAMTFIRGLVSEGLLHPNTFSYAMKDLRTALQSGDMVGVAVGHPTVQFLSTDSVYKWEALDLYGNVYFNENIINRDCMITDSCENPDAAWEVLMALSSKEGCMRRFYGVESRDWEWADNEKTTVRWINVIQGQICNISWQQMGCGIIDLPKASAEDTAENAPLLYRDTLQDQILEYYYAALEKTDDSEACPWLRFNEEEDDIAKNRGSFHTEVKTWRIYFINGTKDVNNPADWQEYLDTLERAGMSAYLFAGQQCYDRMYGTNS